MEKESEPWSEKGEEELKRLLTWFIPKRRRIAWSYGCENLFVNEEGVFGIKANGSMVKIK